MTDYTADAELLFRAFAAKHRFSIEKIDCPEVDLMMCIPAQPGMVFELTLALQNGDEVNIGFEDFWSYFFPVPRVRGVVEEALNGLATGDCRLAVHAQFGRVVKRVLELRRPGRWEPVYTQYVGIVVPLFGTKVSHIYNTPIPYASWSDANREGPSIVFTYNLAGDGWAECTIEAGGRGATMLVSYLSDALRDLLDAVLALLGGAESATFSFWEEPGEFRWRVARSEGGCIRVRITAFDRLWSDAPDDQGDLIFDAEFPLPMFAEAVLSAVEGMHRAHGLERYHEEWGYPFPLDQMNRLSAALLGSA